MARVSVVVGGLVAIFGVACGGSSMASLFPNAPGSDARCRIGATQTSVLVTEWSAAEKANLEGLVNRGAVAVAFSGCQLRLIPECEVGGSYTWQRTTPASESVQIDSEAELYAKLPLGAVSLSGELTRSGSLAVSTTVSGQRRLDGKTGGDVPNQPECAQATHIITAVSLGAFTLTAGDSTRVAASADVTGIAQVGGSYAASGRLVRSSGDASTCSGSTDLAPALDCASPIQAFLSPVPGRAPEPGPPGTMHVDIVSATEARWDVYVDDEATCTTPCSSWVDPNRPLQLRTRGGAVQSLIVDRLDAGMGPVQIAARPRKTGMLATGIVFTALGGMAAVAGISLTGVGCSQEDMGGMCTAGLITMFAGAVVTTGSIFLIGESGAEYGVRPLFGPTSAGAVFAGRLPPSLL